MKGTLKLQNPIKINNEVVTELSYDTDAITVDQFLEADARAHDKGTRMQTVSQHVLETDQSMLYYLGAQSVVADNPEYDLADIDRVQGLDIIALYRVGRFFIKSNVEEDETEESQDSEDEKSDELAEDTQELSTAE